MNSPLITTIIFAILVISFFIFVTIFIVMPQSEEHSSIKENKNCEQLLQIITAVEKQSVRNIASSNWIEQECWK